LTAPITTSTRTKWRFKLAAIFAVKDAFKKAKPILLEPIMKVENATPEEYQGDIMGDLNRRRGKIASIEAKGNLTMVQAEVPLGRNVRLRDCHPLAFEGPFELFDGAVTFRTSPAAARRRRARPEGDEIVWPTRNVFAFV
jgi:hypothetical protein